MIEFKIAIIGFILFFLIGKITSIVGFRNPFFLSKEEEVGYGIAVLCALVAIISLIIGTVSHTKADT